MLKLYDYFRSTASFRVRIALNLKKLSYESIPVHLVNNGGEQFSEDYMAINPQSLVPSLVEGSRVLTQSLAIIEYLEETHPAPALLPKHPYDRARVRSFALTIATDIHPLNNLRVLKYLSNNLSVTDEQKSSWYHHWVAKGFGALEQQLKSHGIKNKFCFGDEPSLADICLVAQMYNANRFNCDVSNYPTLCRIDKECQKVEAFANAWPAETVN